MQTEMKCVCFSQLFSILRGSQTAVYLALNPHEKVELYCEMAAVTAAWFQDKLTAVSFWISQVWSQCRENVQPQGGESQLPCPLAPFVDHPRTPAASKAALSQLSLLEEIIGRCPVCGPRMTWVKIRERQKCIQILRYRFFGSLGVLKQRLNLHLSFQKERD